MNYNIQEIFSMEGYFTVKVTPFGENLCLLEERGECVLEELVEPVSDCFFNGLKKFEDGCLRLLMHKG